MLSPAQCRAARGLLDWSRKQLAAVAWVKSAIIRRFEAGALEPDHVTTDLLQRAFEGAGIIFIAENGDGPGVRLQKRSATAAELTHRIDVLEDDLAGTQGESPQTPAGGMRTLERAHKRNTVTKLKNRRTKLGKAHK